MLSENQYTHLQKLQGFYNLASKHPSTAKSRKNIIENFKFYDGTGQFDEVSLNKLKQRGQQPMTINIVQPRIDSLSGVEIQARYRAACRSDSDKPEDDQLANSLTHQLYSFQRHNNVPYKGSLKFRDAEICGIGWSQIYFEDNTFNYEYIHPLNMIIDPDDLSPQYTESDYVIRIYFMNPERVRKLWPSQAKHIVFKDQMFEGFSSPELQFRSSADAGVGDNSSGSKIPIIEVQYRTNKKAFSGFDYQGNYFETFDIEKAEELAGSKKDIEMIDAERIMRGLFINNTTLLEHGPLNPDLPNLKDFSYIPFVWKRHHGTGVPYGLMEGMKDIQRDLNIRWTKAIYLINSSRLIVQGQLGAGNTPEHLEKQLQKQDGVIILPAGTNFKLEPNTSLADAQLQLIDRANTLMQQVTGIYDDAIGKPSNATSGVMIRERRTNSINNNIFAFDSLTDMKEREARFLLDLFQGSGIENIVSKSGDQDEVKTIILNAIRRINGKKQIMNDIRTLPLSLYIEEVPDYRSSQEEQQQMFASLLGNANANIIMQSPLFMKLFGLRDPEKLSAEMQKINQQKQMAEQGSQIPTPMPGGSDAVQY